MNATEKQVNEILVKVKAKYKDLTKVQVIAAVQKYKELAINSENYVSEFGEYKELFTLTGNIPVNYKQRAYNIPVQIYLSEDFPYKPPICYVRPTQTMSINVNDTVDASGKISNPYIVGWSKKSDLKTLIELIAARFSAITPLYLKSSRPSSSTSGTPGYPSSLPPLQQQQQSSTSSMPPTYPPTTGYGGSGLPYPSSNSQANNTQSGYPTAVASSVMPPYPPATNNSSNAPYPTYAVPTNPYTPGGYVPMPTPNAYQPTKPPVPPPPSSSSYPANISMQPQRAAPLPPSFNSNYSDETLKPEYLQMSMVSATLDKARQRYNEYKDQFDAEIFSLKRTATDLESGEKQIGDIIQDAEIEIENIKKYTTEIKQKTLQINENLNKMKHREKADIQDAIVAPAPLYRQIMQLFAEELAIQDLVYYLNEGLSHKTVSLESYLKQTRVLSRKLFMVRALILKCRDTAGLRT